MVEEWNSGAGIVTGFGSFASVGFPPNLEAFVDNCRYFLDHSLLVIHVQLRPMLERE